MRSSAASIRCHINPSIPIVDGVEGKGQYVGTYMAWGNNNNTWWGEGEIKFFIDGDGEYPTICGTGTEDYFCGSYNFEDPKTHDRYVPFSTPYTGLQVIEPNTLYRSQFRFGLYRWHITDPIRFEKNLRVTIQALGWREGGRISAASGGHCVRRVLVSDSADGEIPAAAGIRTRWKSSKTVSLNPSNKNRADRI